MKWPLTLLLLFFLALANAFLGWAITGVLPGAWLQSGGWLEILITSILLSLLAYMLIGLLDLSQQGRFLAVWFLILVGGILTFYTNGAQKALPWCLLLGLVGTLSHHLRGQEKILAGLSIWFWCLGGYFQFWGFTPGLVFPTFSEAFWVLPSITALWLALSEFTSWRQRSLTAAENGLFPPEDIRTQTLGRVDSSMRELGSEDKTGFLLGPEESLALEAESLKNILDPVVYFMHQNFKAHTSLGYVASASGKEFYLNVVYTRGGKVKADSTVLWGKGLLGDVATKRKIFISGDLRAYKAELDYYQGHQDINSIIVLPVLKPGESRVEGLLVVDSDRVRAFTDQHKESMKRFGQIALALLVNSRLTMQVKTQAEWADTLYEVSRRLNGSLGSRQIYSILTETLPQFFIYDRFFVCTYNPQSALGIAWQTDKESTQTQPQRHNFSLKNPKGIYAHVFRTGKDLLTKNFRNEKEWMRFDTPENPENRPAELLMSPLHDDKGAVLALIGIESDLTGVYSPTELQRMNILLANFSVALVKARIMEDFERQATLDGLTGIPNHRKLQETIDLELSRSNRYHDPLAFFLLDIDHFKKFNDTYGHPMGDIVLKRVAGALQSSIRGSDFCARYGGEEFAVVMIQATHEKAMVLGERIRTSIESLILEYEGIDLHVTVSLGCAIFNPKIMDKKTWIASADKALYMSKENGRNRLTFFKE